jgi:lipid-A-disaccharide synthase
MDGGVLSQPGLGIFLSAAEVSGDIAGARLAAALRDACSDVRLFGCGGRRMAQAGVRVDVDTTDFGVIGLFEILRFIPRLTRAFVRIRSVVGRDQPGVAVLIGYEGFHVPLAWWLRRQGVYTVSLLPPQVWLWGALARPIARSYHEILACVPDEEAVYSKAGGRVTFVGHYLKDSVSPASVWEQRAVRMRLGFREDIRIVTLLPGSRWPEVRKFTSALLGAALRLRDRDPGMRFVLPIADPCYRSFIEGEVNRSKMADHVVVSENSLEALSISHLALLASGTVALEASLLGVPMVIVYRLSSMTVGFVRLLQAMRVIKYDCIGLPNLLLARRVVPELYQKEAAPERMAEVAWGLLEDRARYAEIREQLLGIRGLLGEGRSLDKAASLLLDRLRSVATH